MEKVEIKGKPKVGDLLTNLIIEDKKLICDLLKDIELDINNIIDDIYNIDINNEELSKKLAKEIDKSELLKNILSIIR